MKTLIFGAGNLLLTDEGFGVHFIRYLEAHYSFPPDIELLDAGTMGIMVSHKLEEADRVYIVDIVIAEGQPGQSFRYNKEDFMLKKIPVKMSPHQIGVQEMLLISEMRGRCPNQLFLLGVIPASLELNDALTPLLHRRMIEMADSLVAELRQNGAQIKDRL